MRCPKCGYLMAVKGFAPFRRQRAIVYVCAWCRHVCEESTDTTGSWARFFRASGLDR